MNADIHFLHDSDGLRLVGPDGWTFDLEDADDPTDDDPVALDVPTVDTKSVRESHSAIES